MEKTLATINYDYNTGDMAVVFQTRTDLGGGQYEYSANSVAIEGTDKTTILGVLNLL